MAIVRTSAVSGLEADKLSEALGGWLSGLEVHNLFRTCLTCSNLATDDRTCSIFNKQPPVRIVLTGCDSYIDSGEIPF